MLTGRRRTIAASCLLYVLLSFYVCAPIAFATETRTDMTVGVTLSHSALTDDDYESNNGTWNAFLGLNVSTWNCSITPSDDFAWNQSNYGATHYLWILIGAVSVNASELTKTGMSHIALKLDGDDSAVSLAQTTNETASHGIGSARDWDNSTIWIQCTTDNITVSWNSWAVNETHALTNVLNANGTINPTYLSFYTYHDVYNAGGLFEEGYIYVEFGGSFTIGEMINVLLIALIGMAITCAIVLGLSGMLQKLPDKLSRF